MLNIISNPDYADFASLCTRPAIDQVMLTTGIQTIFNEIKRDGDTALLKYTAMFDNVTLASSIFDVGSMEANDVNISSELKDAIRTAYNNIYKFHSAQIGGDIIVETMPGIICTQKSVPISKVGIYIPGGTAPLFSTVLMLAIPAKIAGCEEIILCTPPDKTGSIHPAILFTAMLCGINEIRLAGGAQAIAALTFGTDEIPAVDKIFGPGNQYVTAAKKLALNYGVSIDMPAGPSEVLVYADDTAIPAYVAADLLAQAEHGGDSQVILVASEMGMIDDTLLEIQKQLDILPRKNIVKEALLNSKAIFISDEDKAFDFINAYAPEHLIIASEYPSSYVDQIVNAGSVFLGNYCPESAGDYASGTNHTLPTNGWARSYSGVNLESFCKKITFQTMTQEGISALGASIIAMAEAEQLVGHANAVRVRLNDIQKSQ